MEKRIWGKNILRDWLREDQLDRTYACVKQDEWKEACKLLNQMEAEKPKLKELLEGLKKEIQSYKSNTVQKFDRINLKPLGE